MRVRPGARTAAAAVGMIIIGWLAMSAVPATASPAPPPPTPTPPGAPAPTTDLALSHVAILGAPDPAPLSVKGVLQVSGDVDNHGTAATSGTLSLVLPTGLQLTPSGVVRNGSKLTCSPTATGVSCDFGVVDPNESADHRVFIAHVSRTNAAKPGSIVKVGVEVEPTGGTDSTPADNTASVAVLITGTADLVATLTPAQATVAPGHSVTLTATVRNTGPDAALNARAGLQLSKHITDWFGQTAFTLVEVRTSTGTIGIDAAPCGTRPHADLPPGSCATWTIGTLAPGASVTATIVAKTARNDGYAYADFSAFSDSTDAACSQCARSSRLVVQAPPTTTAPPPSVGPSTHSNGAGLPATGSPAGALALLAVGLLALGGLVLVMARPARSSGRRAFKG